jgi:TatD DNase family protein
VGVDLETSRRAVELAERSPMVWAAVGHHPVNREAPDLAALRQLAGHPRVVAVGEVGLDRVHPEAAPAAEQESWLRSLCELALERGLPVSVHTRGSEEDVLRVLSSLPGLRGVMHYFSLDRAWAERFLDLGFHLSFAGLVTRPSRGELREVARTCPADRLLLETDAPFGNPHGRMGVPNRPAWLLDTARLVAELRGISVEALGEIELANATSLFGADLC